MAQQPMSTPGAERGARPQANAPFFFEGEAQKRALSYVSYALNKGRGVFLLTGKADTGKSALAAKIRDGLRAEGTEVAWLSAANIGGNDLLRRIAASFGLAHYSLPRSRILGALEDHLREHARGGKCPLLVIDEADSLQVADLTEIATLCKLRTSGRYLLQIFLIGRQLPLAELAEGGRANGMEQLVATYRLSALSQAELDPFIGGWAAHLGHAVPPPLPRHLGQRLMAWSGGRPGRLSGLCEQLGVRLEQGALEAWDEDLVETLVEGVEQESAVVRPAAPPQGLAGAAATVPARGPSGLNSGPALARRDPRPAPAPSGAEPAAQALATPAPETAEVVTETALVAEKPPVARTPRPRPAGGAVQPIDTPLAAICGGAEEALLLAPLLTMLSERFGRCTLLDHRGDVDLTRGPWPALGDRVALRPVGVEEDGPSGAGATPLVGNLEQAAALLSGEVVRLLLCIDDSDATLALALAAQKRGIPVARLEAGRRAAETGKSESVNQALLDRLADALLVPDPLAQVNLLMEGIQRKRIRETGSLRVDALAAALAAHGVRLSQLVKARRGGASPAKEGYALVALRDDAHCSPGKLELLLRVLRDIGEMVPVRLVASTCVMDILNRTGIVAEREKWNIERLQPLDPMLSARYLGRARLVVTDSEYLQVESTALRVPCITLAEHTVWPVTVECGNNRLCRLNPVELIEAASVALTEEIPVSAVPSLWDGHASTRIVNALKRWLA